MHEQGIAEASPSEGVRKNPGVAKHLSVHHDTLTAKHLLSKSALLRDLIIEIHKQYQSFILLETMPKSFI